jgi:hypothetical protein
MSIHSIIVAQLQETKGRKRKEKEKVSRYRIVATTDKTTINAFTWPTAL